MGCIMNSRCGFDKLGEAELVYTCDARDTQDVRQHTVSLFSILASRKGERKGDECSHLLLGHGNSE